MVTATGTQSAPQRLGVNVRACTYVEFMYVRARMLRLFNFVGVAIVQPLQPGVFSTSNHLGNAQLSVIRSIEVAVLQGFTY